MKISWKTRPDDSSSQYRFNGHQLGLRRPRLFFFHSLEMKTPPGWGGVWFDRRGWYPSHPYPFLITVSSLHFSLRSIVNKGRAGDAGFDQVACDVIGQVGVAQVDLSLVGHQCNATGIAGRESECCHSPLGG